MKFLIDKVILNICSKICNEESEDLSLYNGLAGEALFLFYYTKYNPNDTIAKESFEKKISFLSEKLYTIQNSTFCSGIAGIQWLFSFLYHQKIIYARDKKILCDDSHNDLKTVSMNLLDIGNYDFLHGSLGVFYYLLYSSNGHSDNYFKNYLYKLESMQIQSSYGKFIPNMFFVNNKDRANEINLGLSHGLPSILKVLLECIRKGISVSLCKKIAYDIIDCLFLCMNKDVTKSYFPSLVNINSNKSVSTSRLAWCYGDLGLAYVLYQAGKVLNDAYLENRAIEILEASTKRKDVHETKLFDFGICHGIAGVVHLYKRIWDQTKLPIFKVASEYWLSQLTASASNDIYTQFYQKFFPPENKYLKSHSFLEGAIGAGLVLLSYQINESDWDYAIMLNN